MNKLKIYKKSILEMFIALCFLLPYAETGILKNTLEYYNDKVYIHPMSFIIIIILFINILLLMTTYKTIKIVNYGQKYLYIFSIVILISGSIFSYFNQNLETFFVQYIWFIIPLVYSITIVNIIKKFNLSFKNILKIGLFYFALYCLFSIGYSMVKFGFKIGTTTRLTGGSGGGGSVIFGYTIVLFYCILILLRKDIDPKSFVVYGIIFFITSILTQSRGSMWSIFTLTVILVLDNKSIILKLLLIMIGTFFIMIINPFEIVANYAPRLFKFDDEARTGTWNNAINVFVEQPFFNILYGTGLGQFFPYQSWIINGKEVYNLANTFIYEDKRMLVQPHNTFIYFLIETGIFGIGLFMKAFFDMMRKLKKYNKNGIFIILFIVLLNCFDAVFIILPGIAGVWWCILLFTINYCIQEKDIELKSSV